MYGLKDTYDLAFSIGGACACSQSLRRAGMQYASFPFDWLVNYPSVPFAARTLADGFTTLLCREKMVCHGLNSSNDKDVYQNKANGLYFLHDFPRGGNFEATFPVIKEKYRRRAARLSNLLDRGGNVLLVYVTIPNAGRLPDSEFVEALEIIVRAFPRCSFDLLCLSQKKADFSGVEMIAPHVFRADFDYQSHVPGSENIANEHVVAAVLKKIVRKVRDYRTADERAKYKVESRKKKYRLFKAETWWRYALNKVTWKLFRHFQNRLERQGFKF